MCFGNTFSKYFFKHACQYLARSAAIQPFRLEGRRGINFSRELIPGPLCTADRYKVYREMRLGKYCVATCKVSASAETWDSLRMHFICRTSLVRAWFASGRDSRSILTMRATEQSIATLFLRKNIYALMRRINFRINSSIGGLCNLREWITKLCSLSRCLLSSVLQNTLFSNWWINKLLNFRDDNVEEIWNCEHKK